MLATALAAERHLRGHGVSTTVVNVPVIKPLDTATVERVAAACRAVVTAENHSIVGGLGTAVAETLAEAGVGRRLHRIGLADTFAEGAATAAYLFDKYGLSTRHVVERVWTAAGRSAPGPSPPTVAAEPGEYAPV